MISKMNSETRSSKVTVLFIILIVITLIISSIMIFAINQFKEPVEIMNIKTNVTISNKKIGFELGHPDAITFGTVRTGSVAKRSITLTNSHSFPVKAKIFCEGEICSRLSFENEVSIKPNGQTPLEFRIESPSTDSLGYYEGNIKIEIYRAIWK